MASEKGSPVALPSSPPRHRPLPRAAALTRRARATTTHRAGGVRGGRREQHHQGVHRPGAAEPAVHPGQGACRRRFSFSSSPRTHEPGADRGHPRRPAPPALGATQVNSWCSLTVEHCLKRLTALNKPFKYIVTCVIMQKNGAGLHTSSSCYWDNSTDGSRTVRWENKSMYCIATVFGVAI